MALISMSGCKLVDLIKDYDKDAVMELSKVNLTDENVNGLVKGLANECYGRLKKKLK